MGRELFKEESGWAEMWMVGRGSESMNRNRGRGDFVGRNPEDLGYQVSIASLWLVRSHWVILLWEEESGLQVGKFTQAGAMWRDHWKEPDKRQEWQAAHGRTETAKLEQGKESVGPWPSGRAGLGEDGRYGVGGGPSPALSQAFQLSRESCTQCCFLLVKPELHSLQPHDDTVM